MNEERKRIIIIVAVTMGLIIGAVAIGWIYYSVNPTAWTDLTAELSGETVDSPAPRPVPSEVRRPTLSLGALRASGNIETDEVTLAAQIGGIITETEIGEFLWTFVAAAQRAGINAEDALRSYCVTFHASTASL